MPVSLDKRNGYSGNEIGNRAKTSLATRVKGWAARLLVWKIEPRKRYSETSGSPAAAAAAVVLWKQVMKVLIWLGNLKKSNKGKSYWAKRGLACKYPQFFILAPRRKRRLFRGGEKRDDCIRRLMGALLDQFWKRPLKKTHVGVARALFEPLNTLSKKTHKTYLQLPNHKTKQKEKKRNTVAI